MICWRSFRRSGSRSSRRHPKLLGTPYKFAKQGQSGIEMSELWPNLTDVADELCVIKSMHTDQFNHAPAELFLYTGSPRNGGAAMGSWITYGLGSENQDLPGFVVLISGGTDPTGGKALWSTGYLPSVYQGVQCRTAGDPILYANNPTGMNREVRRRSLDALAAAQRAGAGRVRRSRDADAHQPVRAGLPHADRRARGDGHLEGAARRSSSCTAPSRARRRSPTIACSPGGWSSRACATCSSSTGAGTPTAPAPATTS